MSPIKNPCSTYVRAKYTLFRTATGIEADSGIQFREAFVILLTASASLLWITRAFTRIINWETALELGVAKLRSNELSEVI